MQPICPKTSQLKLQCEKDGIIQFEHYFKKLSLLDIRIYMCCMYMFRWVMIKVEHLLIRQIRTFFLTLNSQQAFEHH